VLRRLVRINDFRVFQGWAQEPAAIDFESVNLIYGVNGSGKSTLASLLAAAPRDEGWTTGLRVTIEDQNGQSATVSTPDHDIWQSLRVFNKDYVAANLRFDSDGDSRTEPLLVLGKGQIDREAHRAAATDRLTAIAQEQPEAKEARSSTEKARDALATRTATLIAEELGVLGGRYAPRSYDARQVKRLLEGPSDIAADEDVSTDLAVVRSSSLPQLAVPPRQGFNVRALEDAVRDLLARKATAQPIEALRADATKAAWVQAGLPLHDVDDACLFCGSAFTDTRLAELERHFDESLRSLQTDISGLVDRLVDAGKTLAEALDGLPSEHDLYAELRNESTAEQKVVNEAAGGLQSRLDCLRQLTAEKAGSLFSAQELPVDLQGEGQVDLRPLNALIVRHNKMCATLDERRLKAAERVEHQRVEAIRSEYAQYTKQIEKFDGSIRALKKEKLALAAELSALAQERLDAVPLADSLNADLARLLGRDDLAFSLAEDGYIIRRAGEPALYLSEGEKTAISLLYFLKSLDEHDCDRANTIVVIDDPVSSLDSNVVAGVSAHLWARLAGQVRCRQLFLLTHSFDLFRSWSNLLDRVPASVRQRDGIGGTMQELRVRVIRNADGSISRRPFLIPWPDDPQHRNRIRSEYHYLFWRAADTLQDCQSNPTPDNELDAAVILPNVCRRLLEGFLSFHYPEKIGDFRGLVEAAIGDMDESVTRTRIVTFLHQYSHNEEGDISKSVSRPESISILGAVFDLIRRVNPTHYERMCSALHVGPQLMEPESDS
jgi:wobble nucleotide-excising tRNase